MANSKSHCVLIYCHFRSVPASAGIIRNQNQQLTETFSYFYTSEAFFFKELKVQDTENYLSLGTSWSFHVFIFALETQSKYHKLHYAHCLLINYICQH